MADLLNLSRSQLAAFLKDHQAIRQFELLFTTASELLPDTVDALRVESGSAGSKADLALGLLSQIAASLDLMASYPVLEATLPGDPPIPPQEPVVPDLSFWLTPPAVPVSVPVTVPVGTVVAFRFSTIPDTWLELNGQTVNTGDYPELAALYGAGGATMVLDDWRNLPLWGNGTGTVGDVVGYDDRSCIADLSGANTTWTGTGESVLTIANNTGTTSPSVVTTAPYAADAVVDHSHTIPTGNTGSAGGHSHTLSGAVNTAINVVGTHTHTIAGGNHDHTIETFEYQGTPSGGEPVTADAFSVLPQRAVVKWIIKARS